MGFAHDMLVLYFHISMHFYISTYIVVKIEYCIHSVYCILRGRIKGFNSAIYAIKCQQVVIELWWGSYSTVVG